MNSKYLRLQLTKEQRDRIIVVLAREEENEDLVELLLAARSRCRYWWQPGALVSPGTALRKHARCLLDENHDGDHKYPDDNSPL